MHIPNNADVIKVSDSLTAYYKDGPSHHDVIHWFANACFEELDFVFTISAVLRLLGNWIVLDLRVYLVCVFAPIRVGCTRDGND